ncbi:MAG TPA: hypothetical protein VGK20_13150 [Candidatus Binatia bacterium]|jgi:hypothetical protein
MKPRYKVDKRQKELARKQKQERKKEEKLRKVQPEGSAEGEEAPPTDGSGSVPPADENSSAE